MCGHRVQFYDRESFLIRKIVDFVTPALDAGGRAVIVAIRSHLEPLEAALVGEASQRVILLDAEKTLARFMVDGVPDAQRFDEVVGGLLADCAGGPPVAVFGEMVGVLYGQGRIEEAARLEELWEGLLERHPFTLLCGYPMSLFADASHRQAFAEICNAHSQVEALEAVEQEPAGSARLHSTFARLQQSANALEHELAERRKDERLLAQQAERIRLLERSQAELASLATHDSLTGLANRRAFGDGVAHAFARARRTGGSLALLFIDLDDFKSLNDRHGHEAGDRLLQEMARRLGRCVRASDMVCRLGGDEFAVVMEDAGMEDASVLAQRVVDALGEAYWLGETMVSVTASVGIGLYPQDAVDAKALVCSADKAMYRAKALGKARYAASASASASVAAAVAGGDSAARAAPVDPAAWMTVAAAAIRLHLSRPHVVKLIAEKRLGNVLRQPGALPLIPVVEVSRLERELQLA